MRIIVIWWWSPVMVLRRDTHYSGSKNSPTQKVRMLNPSRSALSIRQDSVIGTAERYVDLTVIVESENPE